MKRVFLLCLCLLPIVLFAAERSSTDAAALAAQFMNEQYMQSSVRKVSCDASSFILAHTRAKINSEVPAFYIFNKSDQNGFVVVSADDRTEDVLMFSESGSLNEANANPNLRFWLNRLQKEISAVNDSNAVDKYPSRRAYMVSAIGPLLKNKDGKEITWYQTEPYNNLCPMDERDDTRCLTGCVATAAAQIMYSWRYPAQGKGSHSYTWYNCKDDYCYNYVEKTLSKDFSQTKFDWDNILPSYQGKKATVEQKNAVAELMYCCGVSCNMQYGGEATGGSGSWTDDMGYALITYFGYKLTKFISTYSKSSYRSAKGASVADIPCEWEISLSKMEEYFNADLEAGRPIIMGGEDNSGGHEFVCDGRNSNGYFHINWGWEGDSNCYCKLSALTPTGTSYNFSNDMDAIFGLQPATIDTIHVTDVVVSPNELTLRQNEKRKLKVSILPDNATDKTYFWSTSNSAIATITDNGLVRGVSEGEVVITAKAKDGGVQGTCAVTVTNEIYEPVECDKYCYQFTSRCTTGSNTLGDYTWNIALARGTIGNIDSIKGQQFGTSTYPCSKVSLTTSNVDECELYSIKINAARGSNGDAKLSVYIDDCQIGDSQSLSTVSSEYTFVNSEGLQGKLEIRLENTKKAMFIQSINLNTVHSDIEDLSDSQSNLGRKCIINGQLYIVCGENLYNAQGQLVR